MDEPERTADPTEATIGPPYLTAALLCQNALQESDGVVSLIRIVDHFLFELPDDAPPGALLEAEAVIFVAFKSGSFRGTLPLEIIQHGPQGGKQAISTASVRFAEDAQGPQIITRLRFVTPISGTYWLDVVLDGRVVSRMPIVVEVRRLKSQKADEQ